jgi:hypothetical protein
MSAAASKTMRRCPDCKAPNPAGRTDCYACGQRLDKKPAGTPAPGERTYPCRNCDAAVPFSAAACPGCGRVVRPEPDAPVAGPAPALVAPPPPGWEAEPLPDGTVRLRRTTWARLNHGSGASGLAVLAAAWLVANVFLGRGRYVGVRADGAAPLAWPLYVAIGALLLGGACGLVWALFGRFELRAGPGVLEARWRLWGWYRMRRLDSAVLRIDTRNYWTRHGGQRERRALSAQTLGGALTLDAEERGGDLLSAAVNGLMRPADGPAALGAYLSSLTGFAFVDPARGRY